MSPSSQWLRIRVVGRPVAVGPGDAQPLQVHADQLGGPHPGGQAGGHIVRVASVHVFDPVDVPGLDGGEAGRRGQQVIRSPALGDLLQGQLVGAQAPLFHRHQSEPDGGGPQLFFVQHPPHDVLQRGDVHAALGHELAHRLAQALQTRAGGGQLHHILAADAQPHIPGRLILPQDVHGTVQTADAGAGDHTGLPAQLVQGAPDPYLIAPAGAATGQHQPPAKFFCAHPASSFGPSDPNDHIQYTTKPGRFLPPGQRAEYTNLRESFCHKAPSDIPVAASLAGWADF